MLVDEGIARLLLLINMSKLLPVIVIVAIAIIGGVLLFSNKTTFSPSETVKQEETVTEKEIGTVFSIPKKSAHYETNTPAHGSTLAAPPVNVVIDFNFDLGKGSQITVAWENTSANVAGETVIDANKLAMRAPLPPDLKDGLYNVVYSACWPDGSCHEGNFQFAIDRTRITDYEDLRNRKEVTIDLKDIAFAPKNIRVDPGTKITWINSDEVEHYTNTDSHPAHTYYLAQNSKALKKGDKYSITLTAPGAYPYHCSAHADSMSGNIVVE